MCNTVTSQLACHNLLGFNLAAFLMFKLGLCGESKLRKLHGIDYLAKVIEGVQFKDGIEVRAEDHVAA